MVGGRSCGARPASCFRPGCGWPAPRWRSPARCRAARGFPPRPRSRSRWCWRCWRVAGVARARPDGAGSPVLAGRERVGGRADRPARPDRLAVRRARPGAADRLPLARGAPGARSRWGTSSWSCSTRARSTRTPGRATTSGARECARGGLAAGAEEPARRDARDGFGAARRRCRCASGTWSARTSGCPRRWRRSSAATSRSSAGCSTPRTPACATGMRCPRDAVEDAVARCKQAGALGARIMGGGFGGSVLALLPGGCRGAVGGGAGASGTGGAGVRGMSAPVVELTTSRGVRGRRGGGGTLRCAGRSGRRRRGPRWSAAPRWWRRGPMPTSRPTASRPGSGRWRWSGSRPRRGWRSSAR